MIIQVLGTFMTIYFFSLMSESPKKYLVWAGVVGAIGWCVYLLMENYTHFGSVMGSFISVVVISVVSHISARVYKAPVTLFLVAGILPTVPGAGMYRIVHSLIVHDFTRSVQCFVETIEIAGAISLAIVLVDTIFKLADHSGWKQNSMRYTKIENKKMHEQKIKNSK